ncbi:patatin family protein [Candidatus Saccharibacteria bacterium]|nr:MAG: patatin family protein [Candidatus Saccharibacteria bacterium]
MMTLYDVLKKHQENPKDKRLFGLVLQGGGMRAAYSAGAIVPLIEYSFASTFEHVIGSSAGAINGAYFLGGDIETYHTYTDDLTNKNFVNLLRQDKKVNIDYLVDLVLKHKRPVNIPNLLNSRSQLHVILTDAITGKKTIISDHHKFAQIYEEFRATAALPIFYDKKVTVEGRDYIDGGVADLIPIDIAVKLGCTDIVVVMTQRIENYHFDRRHDRLIKRIIKQLARKQPQAIQAILPTNEKLLQANLRFLRRPHRKVRLYILEPSNNSTLVQIYETDKPDVERLARLGITDMDEFYTRT